MRQRHHLTLGLVALAIGVLIFPACKKEEAVKALPPPDVLVQDAATRDVPVYREWIGTLDGSENAEIRARVTGYLLKRDYQEGALVKKGDVLFEIDPRPFEAALAEAKSQLGQAQAMQLASQAEAERSQELFDKKVISEKEHTNKIQLNESSAAKVEALKANVEQAQLNLNFCKVTSPVEGIAGIARAQVGDLVGTANSTVLTSVSTLDPIKILFPVSEAEYLAAANRIQEGIAMPLDKRPEFIDLILADGKTFPKQGPAPFGRPAGERFDRDDSRHGGFKKSRQRVATGLVCASAHHREYPQGRRCRAAAGGDGNPRQLSACHRRRGREGGNPSRAGRAARGHGLGDHFGPESRRESDRRGHSESESRHAGGGKTMDSPRGEIGRAGGRNETR